MGEGILDELQPHISELFRRLKHIGIAFVIVLLTVFMLNPLKLTYGLTGSFTVYVFRLISQNIGGVKIITISPFESLFTDLFLGVVISVMILLPYILHEKGKDPLMRESSFHRDSTLLFFLLLPTISFYASTYT